MSDMVRTFEGTVDAAGEGLVTIVVAPNCLPRISEGDKVHVMYLHDDAKDRWQILHPDGVDAANAVLFTIPLQSYVTEVIQAYLAASGERA